MDDLFAPPGQEWIRVQPELASMKRLTSAITAALVLLAVLAGTAVLGVVWPWGVLGGVVVVVAEAIGFVVIGRRVRNWGYAELESELWITHGALYRTLSVVPFGRMQLVDVTVGPIERRFGLATVKLHTASAETDSTIPGLLPGEAARLRDRLTVLGEAESAGL